MKKLERTRGWFGRQVAWISSTWLVSSVLLFIIKTPCPYRAREAVRFGNSVGRGVSRRRRAQFSTDS